MIVIDYSFPNDIFNSGYGFITFTKLLISVWFTAHDKVSYLTNTLNYRIDSFQNK